MANTSGVVVAFLACTPQRSFRRGRSFPSHPSAILEIEAIVVGGDAPVLCGAIHDEISPYADAVLAVGYRSDLEKT
jgi:hypothetical protein